MSDKPVILITGTRTGIGKYLAEHYSDNGFLVIGCSRSKIEFELDNYLHYNLNVSDESAVKELFGEIRRKYGRLDGLINNAGLSSDNYAMLTSGKESMDIFNTNFQGTFLFCREASKLMKRRMYGRIINISSIHVSLGTIGSSIYGASKAAIEQFSKVLAKELYPFGITVNVLCLSVVKDTGMQETLSDELRDQILGKTISKSQLDLSDVTNTLDFLLSLDSKMLTNQTIYLGGI